jgi:lysophospholipase L1-like esterase
MIRSLSLLAAVLLLGQISLAVAQEKAPEAREDRWEPAIRKFEEADAKTPPTKGGILFLGSSSIVRWDLKKSFPDLELINRGFGGSEIADSVRHFERIVPPHAPRLVVFYAGDNDLRSGRTPEQVRDDFVALCKKLHAALPETKIIFFSIKPSPSRIKLLSKQIEANHLIQMVCEEDPRREYLSVVREMLGDDGLPREELFVADQLHLSPAGYELWTKKLRPLLDAEKN